MGVGFHVTYSGELGGRPTARPRRDTDWLVLGDLVLLPGSPRALFGGTRKRRTVGFADPVIGSGCSAVGSEKSVLHELEERGLRCRAISCVRCNNRDIRCEVESHANFLERMMQVPVKSVDGDNERHADTARSTRRRRSCLQIDGCREEQRHRSRLGSTRPT